MLIAIWIDNMKTVLSVLILTYEDSVPFILCALEIKDKTSIFNLVLNNHWV